MSSTPLIDSSPISILTLILIAMFCVVSVIQMGLRAAGGVRASQWVVLANVVTYPLLLVVVVILITRLIMILVQNAPNPP